MTFFGCKYISGASYECPKTERVRPKSECRVGWQLAWKFHFTSNHHRFGAVTLRNPPARSHFWQRTQLAKGVSLKQNAAMRDSMIRITDAGYFCACADLKVELGPERELHGNWSGNETKVRANRVAGPVIEQDLVAIEIHARGTEQLKSSGSGPFVPIGSKLGSDAQHRETALGRP